MAIDMYDITAPVYTRLLTALGSILSKAKTHAEERGIDATSLLESRLYPDMFNLKQQVQEACRHALGLDALPDMKNPNWPDSERSIDDLIGSIDKTIALIEAIPPEKINDLAETQLDMRGRAMNGLEFQLRFNQANFYFHVTTAYNILRHNGVTIGKRDFLGL